MTDSDKGKRRVEITPELLGDIVAGGRVTNTDLPDDAECIRVYPAERGNTYFLVYESDEWDPLMEGETIPKTDVDVLDLEGKLHFLADEFRDDATDHSGNNDLAGTYRECAERLEELLEESP